MSHPMWMAICLEASERMLRLGARAPPRPTPARTEPPGPSRYARYPIGELRAFVPGEFESVHGGYATDHANADPNRLVPLDVARRLEKAGRIGRLHEGYYTTVGNGASVQKAQP